MANVKITYRVSPSGRVSISNTDKRKVQKEAQKVIDKEVEKIVDEWEDLILGNDTFWDMYWDMLREAVNEHSRKIAEQCKKV